MRVKILIIVFCLFGSKVFASMFDEPPFSENCPGGGVISYCGDGCDRPEFCLGKVWIENLKHWYFYKGNVIGEFEKDKHRNYFVANSVSNKIVYFRSEQHYKQYLKYKKLIPYWQRDYSWHWSFAYFIEDLGFLFLVVGFFIVFPLLIVIIGFLVLAFISLIFSNKDIIPAIKEVLLFIWKFFWRFMLYLALPFLIINCLLCTFPSSI